MWKLFGNMNKNKEKEVELKACRYAGLPCPPPENETTDFYQLKNERFYSFIDGYKQADKDLALTAADVAGIFSKVRELQARYPATEGCFQDVADWFNEKRK